MGDNLQGIYKTKVTDTATAAAQEELGTIRYVQSSTGMKTYKYVKAAGTIAAANAVKYDLNATTGADYTVLVGAADNYGAGIAVVAMSTTTPYAWIQVGGYVSGLASLTANQIVAAAAAGAVTSNAAPSANDLGTSVALTATTAILKGLV